MERFLPTRLSLNTKIKYDIENKNKKKAINSLPKVFPHELNSFLKRINANEKIKERLLKKKITTLKELLDIAILPLIDIIVGEDGNIYIELFKKILQEKENLINLNTQKTKKIEIYTIVPDNEIISKVKSVNKAINTLANFTTDILPGIKDIISFNSTKTNNDKYSYWIQDQFLSFKEVKSSTSKRIIPVDDSMGRIELIAFSHYDYDTPYMENSYNKIYADLLLKFAKVFHSFPSIIQKDNSEKERLVLLEDSENYKYNDHADILKVMEDRISKKTIKIDLTIKGGNVLFVDNLALVGYDSILKSRFEINNQEDLNKVFSPYQGMHKLKKKQVQFEKDFKKHEDDFRKHFAFKTGIPEENIIFIGSKEILAEGLRFSEDHFKSHSTKVEYNWTDFGRFSAQGIYHIDLFITPAGKEDYTDKNRLVIGDPIHVGKNHIPLFDYTKKVVNKIVNQLIEDGKVSVYRNPLPLTYIDRFDENDKLERKRKWFFASYNNCIVQYTPCEDQRYVWLPIYGGDFSNEFIEELDKVEPKNKENNTKPSRSKITGGNWSYLKKYDEENKLLWESLGFKVVKLTNYLPLAEVRGAARCISKVLYRSSIPIKK